MSERVGVVNKHFVVDMSEANTMSMLYKIDSGFVEEQHYGLALARAIDLPPQVLEIAEQVSKTLSAQIVAKKKSSKAYALNRRRRLVLNVMEMLEQSRDSAMDEVAMGSWLGKLQSEFVRQMDALEDDTEDSETENPITGVKEQHGQKDPDFSVDSRASQSTDLQQ